MRLRYILGGILLGSILVTPVGATHAPQGVPVTIVAIPWGMARIDDGEPFVVPSTRVLGPGEYRLLVEKNGYLTAQRTLRVEAAGPQHHLVRLERR